MTLLEITVASVLLVIVLGAVYLSLNSSMDAERTGVATAAIEQDGRRVLDQVALDLRSSAASQVTIANVGGIYTLTANQNTGYVGGAITWAAPVTYTVAYAVGEINNGVDDNRNQLVDEMVITRTQNGVTRTLAESVKENSFTCVIANNAVTVTFKLQTIDAKNIVVERTHTTSSPRRNN